MGGVIGLDVGGANTKAVWRNGPERRVASRPFEVWRDREALAAVIREVVAGVAPEPGGGGGADHDRGALGRVPHEARGRGVRARCRGGRHWTARSCSPSRPPGRSSRSPEARARAPEVAAANWLASALAVAAVYPDALVIDVGSTTADVIPIAAGQVVAAGRTDLDRLLAGELVYTGALRTNLAAIAPRVPVQRRLLLRSPRSCSRSAPTCT